MTLMEVDDGGRINIEDNTYNGNAIYICTWRFSECLFVKRD